METVMPDTKLPTNSEIFNYREHGKALVQQCPVCGNRDLGRVRCLPDRYGYNVMVIACPECGLHYLSETLTRAGYDAFYAGPYRRLVWAHRWPTKPFEQAESERQLLRSQRIYAQHLAAFLLHFTLPQNARVLDAGGSTGLVGDLLRLQTPIASLTVLDPAADELKLAANAHTIRGYLEDPIAGGPYNLVLCCETLDHVVDPIAALRNMRKVLAPGGMLFVDVVSKKTWAMNDSRIKIDHPLYWTKGALGAALQKAGFTVEAMADQRLFSTWKVRAVCRMS
jgi:SAM-dependent methyltransferase